MLSRKGPTRRSTGMLNNYGRTVFYMHLAQIAADGSRESPASSAPAHHAHALSRCLPTRPSLSVSIIAYIVGMIGVMAHVNMRHMKYKDTL